MLHSLILQLAPLRVSCCLHRMPFIVKYSPESTCPVQLICEPTKPYIYPGCFDRFACKHWRCLYALCEILFGYPAIWFGYCKYGIPKYITNFVQCLYHIERKYSHNKVFSSMAPLFCYFQMTIRCTHPKMKMYKTLHLHIWKRVFITSLLISRLSTFTKVSEINRGYTMLWHDSVWKIYCYASYVL